MIKDLFGGWMFDLDQREALTDILKEQFDSKQINTFLILLELICFDMKRWQDFPSGTEIRKKANPLLNSLKKTIDHLVLLEKEELANGVCFGFSHFVGSDFEAEDNRHRSRHVYSISKSAEASRISLEELKTQIERQLEAWKNPPIKPTADSHSFIFDMAKRYLETFHEMPTTTTEGTLYQVVATALEFVGSPSDHPQRAIRQAITKLKVTIAH